MIDLEEELRLRLEQLHTCAPGTIGDMLGLELVDCDPPAGAYMMRCRTQPWMRNIAGTLHGGLCATLVDQAMGCVAYCAKPGEGGTECQLSPAPDPRGGRPDPGAAGVHRPASVAPGGGGFPGGRAGEAVSLRHRGVLLPRYPGINKKEGKP